MNATATTLLLIARDADADEVAPVCSTSNDYDGRMNLRILSIFMILLSSGIGVFFPLLASTYSFIKVPDIVFFVAKFFGSGVIVATAFIHLLQPANEALSDPCLTGTFQDYPWAFGICLMSLFLLFLFELIGHHLMTKSTHRESDEFNKDDNKFANDNDSLTDLESGLKYTTINNTVVLENTPSTREQCNKDLPIINSIPGNNHFSHESDHQDLSQIGTPLEEMDKESYASQMLSVSFLEFGVIFHSVFVGLALAVSGDEFITLFIVLIFHQMFEGLGLGTRIAEVRWPNSRRLTPWMFGLGFTFTTPIAIAIGLGVRHSFVPGSRKSLISNGVFDALSSGILIYTGLIELMAHEFLFSNQFKGENGFKKMIFAYTIMCCGVALMALLGRWA